MTEKIKRYIYISLSLAVLTIIIMTVSCTKRVWEAPAVGEVLISSINSNSASVYLADVANKGFEIILLGICWNTSPNPTISNNNIQTNNGDIDNLSPGTKYYVRGFASNKIGLSYGEESSFTTSATTPTITTISISSITSTSALGGGNITSDGGFPITARGVCWSTFQNPTISNSKTSEGPGTGGFTSSITGLLPGVQYIVRAYATNSLGTSYGNNVSFTTSITLPTITTSSVTSVSSTTATSGGNITSDGGSTVTARGVCWSTSQNPTISNSKTTNGAGTGNFTSSITGLLPGTTYYVRAYATNSVGTAYGNEDTLYNFPVVVGVAGRIWMDRNLGASRVATSSTDAEAYGDLYQWGRAPDGHEKRSSGTTNTLSFWNSPGHANFITNNTDPLDWRSPQNNNLWQGLNGINNPCPEGFRLPTSNEWEDERQTWATYDASGAFGSPLKLTIAGFRDNTSLIRYVNSAGLYWSSSPSYWNNTWSNFMFISSSQALAAYNPRVYGLSVRCIKDQ